MDYSLFTETLPVHCLNPFEGLLNSTCEQLWVCNKNSMDLPAKPPAALLRVAMVCLLAWYWERQSSLRDEQAAAGPHDLLVSSQRRPRRIFSVPSAPPVPLAPFAIVGARLVFWGRASSPSVCILLPVKTVPPFPPAPPLPPFSRQLNPESCSVAETALVRT